mmetsp:Transcript_49109/g.131442  ORF Transcript_49109/g.131442 Transcript_49109/m.131442 type:complete len:282 (-) Transcript_49109:159-1004(-)
MAREVLRLEKHAREAEDERQQADQGGADAEADPELPDVPRGVDALPEREVEDLGAEDSEAEGHRHLEAAVAPGGHLVPVLLLEVHPAPDRDADAKDENHDADRLDPVRHDGGGEAANHGVEHGDNGERDHTRLWGHARELLGHVAHGFQLANEVDEHVVDQDEGDVDERNEPEAVEHPVGDVGAVRHLLPEYGGQDAHDEGPKGDGHAVADEGPPTAHHGSLRRSVQQPATRRGRADAEGDAEPALRVPGAVPEVGAFFALSGHPPLAKLPHHQRNGQSGD